MSTGIRFVAEHYDLNTEKTLVVQELRLEKGWMIFRLMVRVDYLVN